MRDKVLVAGASGLIGVSAARGRVLWTSWVRHWCSEAKARLPKRTEHFGFVSVDFREEKAAHAELSSLTGVSHVAYAAIYENADDLISGWSNDDQIEVNNAMLRNVIEPLVAGKSALKHVSVLQAHEGLQAFRLHPIASARPVRAARAATVPRSSSSDQQDYVRDAGPEAQLHSTPCCRPHACPPREIPPKP